MAKRIVLVTLILALVIGYAGIALGVSSYATSFKSTYPTSPLSSLSTVSGQAGNLCTVCHGSSGGSRNSYGSAFSGAGRNFKSIEAQDSDGDTFSNLVEINAGTFPGNASSTPAPAGDTTAPVVTAFSIPASASSLTVSITTLTATDAVGITGYLVNESSAKPSASAAGWSGTKPASYTFGSAGAKTLYAWAKDAAGNVSNNRSASVTITLPPAADTTAPVVTVFSIPATSGSLTVSISALSATDSVGVTGYLLTETSAKPSAAAGGWSTTAPANYTFGTAGAKTLYAWARDEAGNVSNSLSAKVTITISSADTTPPTITSFDVPAVSNSLKVAITSFDAADDNSGIAGYMVKKSSTQPSADDSRWKTAPPASIKFGSEGVKTIYAWTKDAAGNISAMGSAMVMIKVAAGTITIPVPNSQETFSYNRGTFPVEKNNLAKAKPLGIAGLGDGGENVVSLQASIGPFNGPVDAYISIISPAEAGSLESSDVYSLRPDATFGLMAAVNEPWRQNVTDINEHIMDIPAGDLLPGHYILILTITPTGVQDRYYKWVTSFVLN